MALTSSREIKGKDFVEYLEQTTGKKILSWRHAPNRFGREVFFTDKTMCFVEEGVHLGYLNLQFEEMPKSICVSCGEEMHISTFDRHGRCTNTLTEFYKNMRKVYWHRYSKNKK